MANEATVPLILVIDDHRVTADIEKEFLITSGYSVLIATTPAEVEKFVTENHIDLLIIDIGFAKNAGLKTLKLAKHYSCNKELKSLVTSVIGLQEIRGKAIKAGADKFLIKPTPRAKIIKDIKALTSQKARDAERVPQTLEVILTTSNNSLINANSLDISEDGIHLHSKKHTPEIGTILSLEFILPNIKQKIVLKGEVVRHTEGGFGVKFIDMPRMAKRNLDKFLLANSMEAKATPYYL